MKRLLVTAAAAALLTMTATVAALTAAPPAQAASLVEVTNFGTNPSNLRMHLYVPDRLATRPAVLLAVHYCTGTGPAFYSGTRFAALADQYGFIVIYPSATRSGQCFDVSSPQALRHDGGSDPVGLVSMVRYVQQRYSTDTSRTFVTGASSGAMMTNVLLGDYPDVFRAGSAFMGVPFACFATTDGSSWNSQCAQGQIDRTPQAWGDLVRAAYPGYSGSRPRMQVWHGVNDDTLRYPNFNEEIDQWTNVLGVSRTPVLTDTPRTNWTRTRYGANTVQAPVEAISVANTGHNLPQDGMAEAAIAFFGLDQNATPGPSSPGPSSPRPSSPGPSSPGPSSPGPSSPAPVGGCRITYAVQSWNTGLTASVTVANTGTAPINGWSLAFTLPAGQRISYSWSTTITGTSGAVTAANASYNGTIAPNSSTSFGFQATHTGDTGKPTSFTLNGNACAVA